MTWTLIQRLLTRVTSSPESAESIAGDLVSGFRTRGGRARATLWLFWALIRITTCYGWARIFAGLSRPVRYTPEQRRRSWPMAELLNDLRQVFRGLRASPGFAAVAVVTLALGVGANTAIFSLVHSVALRPLPYPEQERLVRIWPGQWMTKGWIRSFQAARSFEGVSGFASRTASITGIANPRELYGGEVTVNHFDVVRVRPMLGRPFIEADEAVGAEPVAILSYQLWQQAFGGDSTVIGKVIKLASRDVPQHRVVGIMPEGHRPLLGGWEFWKPLTFNPDVDYPDSDRSCTCWRLLGRVNPAYPVERVDAEVATIGARIQSVNPNRMPKERLATAGVVHFLEDQVGDVSGSLFMLLGAVGLVLLVAIVNVANLQLARGEARRRDLAIRVAMGAGRWRLVRQGLLESLTLGILGGTAGLVLAGGLTGAFAERLPDILPRSGGIGLHPPVVLFSFATAVVAGLLFSLPPSLAVFRSSPAEVIGTGRSSAGQAGRGRVRHALVAFEVALAAVLVVGAGLMVRTIQSLFDVDPGFRTSGLLTLRVNVTGDRYVDHLAVEEFFDRALSEVAALPGVTRVADNIALPLTGMDWGWSYTVDTEPLAEGEAMPNSRFLAASPDFFRVMDIPLLAGRSFDQGDLADGEPVAIVNASFAKQHWGEATAALDHVITLNTGRSFRIVGVVADVHYGGLSQAPSPEMYRPSAQFGLRQRYLVIDTERDPGPLSAEVMQVFRRIDPDVPVLDLMPMDALAARSVGETSLYAQIVSAFAVLALILGMIGVYGVLAFTVNQTRRAIGVRMALGAAAGHVMWSTMKSGLVPVLLGLAAGIPAAIIASRVMESQLYGVTVTDPTTMVAVAVLFLLSAVAACYLPARRAAKVDPMQTLRVE